MKSKRNIRIKVIKNLDIFVFFDSMGFSQCFYFDIIIGLKSLMNWSKYNEINKDYLKLKKLHPHILW